MARRPGQSISRTAALVGCSQSAVVSIYQKWSKKGTVVNQHQGHRWPRLIDARREWTLLNCSQLLRLLKKVMLALIERCQNTQCIAVCCVWGCRAADQSGCPCWPLSIVESTNNGQLSIRTGPWSNGRRWPGLMNHVFFYIMSMAGLLTWGTNGTRMHYEKKTNQQKQCDALGNVLLGNLGSCHPYGCYSDTYHLPKHCCRQYSLMMWPLSAG